MKNSTFRIGHGFDVHRFGPEGPLVLGGIEIPHDRGLEAHSDGDCLVHAIADAILGALGLPDIGNFFPNDDPDIEGINSLEILREVVEKCNLNGYEVNNLDTTIVAETPKLNSHVHPMKESLARTIGIHADQIGIKATTNERMGSIGRNEGIAAFAVCLIVAKAN